MINTITKVAPSAYFSTNFDNFPFITFQKIIEYCFQLFWNIYNKILVQYDKEYSYFIVVAKNRNKGI